MVTGSGERARRDQQETLRPGNRRIGVEGLWRHELGHLGVPRRRLEILAHGEEIDVGRTHVVHYLMDLQTLLAEAHHDSGLGEDAGIMPLHALQQAQRSIITRARSEEPTSELQSLMPTSY